MSKQYPGGIISKTAPVPTQVAASGVWTLDQQAYWQKLGQWPAPPYQILRSLRFNSADTAYLNRTPASAGNRRTWTWSGWVKRGLVDLNYRSLFSNGNAVDTILFWNDNSLAFRNFNGSSYDLITTQVFRDPSAWYHLVIAMDTTQATASNRVKIYVNGVQVTVFATATYPSQNYDTGFNTTTAQYLGYNEYNYFNGYMTEVNFIDGQALTPSSFGYTDANTGVWTPYVYTGTYGTNGFYLNFSDNSNTTAATLGKDYSGNGNNWTPNNFSVTAGAGNDSMVDSPTPFGTDTGAGGSVRGNYATLNPLQKGSTVNIANGNLDVSNSTSGGAGKILGTIGVSSGKWYAEATMSGGGGMPGISEFTANTSQYPGGDAQSWGYNNGGDKYFNGSNAAYGATFSTNDVIGLALDMDVGTITFYKNNVSQGVAFSSGIVGKTITFAGRGDTTTTESWNFGQRPFAYTAPSGFKALCTQNLPTPTIGATSATLANAYFTPVIYTGTNANQSISLPFAPDFLWFKSRSSAVFHALFDILRGRAFGLSSNSTNTETTYTSSAGNDLVSFDSGGFSVGPFQQWTSVNGSGSSEVAWAWKANGAGVTNTAGSITSTVSANTTAGFSIVTYSGNSTEPSTVGHGLGVAPSMIIIKGRNDSTYDWNSYHISLGNTQYIALNTTAAASSAVSLWNNTSPTSTVFTVNHVAVNASGTNYVAYCFAPIAGYSAFGSYTGNGSADGPFVFTGFRPAYVMVKRSSSSGTNWQILDTKRSTYNVMADYLYASAANAEAYDTSVGIDSLSNGFKIRGTDGNTNTSTATYIYMAFAEFPFKYSLAR
jgi:hypothetical protein